ncbi:MAG: SGNH/GDSL hydrolase family protein [Oscillospiraceae bacterium]|nr:SGNH/GDSL hydrolase family protein [Oscillospiraceae bacterium]
MQLTYEQIKSITTGAVCIEQEENGIRFYRFNREQQTLYQPRIRLLEEKMLSTAGIQMFFKTDSSTLYLRTTVTKGSGSDHFSFDLFVNGKHVDSLDNFSHLEPCEKIIHAPCELGTYEKTFALGDGVKDICIYFPWSVATTVENISLENDAFLTPNAPAKKMLVYGDSVTHGNVVRYSCNHYIPRLARAMNVQVRNKAIAGTTTFPQMAELESPYEPDYVWVAYGSNDWDRHEEAFFVENYSNMMQIIANKYPHAQVFAVSPIWRADQDTKARRMGPLATIEKNILEIAADYPNVTVISGIDLVPHDFQYFADAGLHPNDEGNGFYFQNIWPKVTAALKD